MICICCNLRICNSNNNDNNPTHSCCRTTTVGVSVTSLILFPVNESVEKVAAALSNAMMINNTGLYNPASNKSPIYQASGWTFGVTKLKPAGFPQRVELIFENGSMNGVGKVTNLETWIISRIEVHGLGNGVITTKDKQMVTWTAHDIGGTNNKNRTATYWGDIIFHGAKL